MRRALLPLAFVIFGCSSEPATEPPLIAPPRSAGPVARHSASIALSPDANTLYVVNADADSVSVLDTQTRRLTREVLLADRAPTTDPATRRYDVAVGPRALAVSPGARRLYVTGQRSGALYIYNLDTFALIQRVAVGSEPVGVIISPDERNVFVACAMDNTVVRVDAQRRAVAATLKLAGKPWSLGWSSDASALHVSELLGPGVAVVDPARMTLTARWSMPPIARQPSPLVPNGDSRGMYDVVTRPGTNEVWVPHLVLSTETAQLPINANVPDSPLELNFETTVFPGVSAFRDGQRATVMSVASMQLDPQQRRRLAFNDITSGPHAIEFTPDGRWALVVNANSDDILVVDAERKVQAPGGLVRPLGGRANLARMPEAVVISPDGAHAWIDARNTSNVVALRLTAESDRLVATVDGEPIPRLTRDPMPANLRNGQRVFYSANSDELPITTNHWVACASCHIEGRSDGVMWRFKSGPRDTPSNAGGTIGTGFLLRTAVLRDVTDYWRIIVEEQGGRATADEPYLPDLRDYVNLAIPFPVPPRTDPALVARGREIFNRASVGCATCHRGSGFNDSGDMNPTLDLAGPVRLYDVGSCNRDPVYPDRAHQDAQGHAREPCQFDTPTLRGVADSAPYLHDGSAPTLLDVLERTRGRMGDINGLSRADLDALVEYMRSL